MRCSILPRRSRTNTTFRSCSCSAPSHGIRRETNAKQPKRVPLHLSREARVVRPIRGLSFAKTCKPSCRQSAPATRGNSSLKGTPEVSARPPTRTADPRRPQQGRTYPVEILSDANLSRATRLVDRPVLREALERERVPQRLFGKQTFPVRTFGARTCPARTASMEQPNLSAHAALGGGYVRRRSRTIESVRGQIVWCKLVAPRRARSQSAAVLRRWACPDSFTTFQ